MNNDNPLFFEISMRLLVADVFSTTDDGPSNNTEYFPPDFAFFVDEKFNHRITIPYLLIDRMRWAIIVWNSPNLMQTKLSYPQIDKSVSTNTRAEVPNVDSTCYIWMQTGHLGSRHPTLARVAHEICLLSSNVREKKPRTDGMWYFRKT